jgi:hypothetical protein
MREKNPRSFEHRPTEDELREEVFAFFRILATGDAESAFARINFDPWRGHDPEETPGLTLRLLWEEMEPYFAPLKDKRFEGPWLRSITPPEQMPAEAIALHLEGPILINVCFLGQPTDFTAQFSLVEEAGRFWLKLDMIHVM